MEMVSSKVVPMTTIRLSKSMLQSSAPRTFTLVRREREGCKVSKPAEGSGAIEGAISTRGSSVHWANARSADKESSKSHSAPTTQ